MLWASYGYTYMYRPPRSCLSTYGGGVVQIQGVEVLIDSVLISISKYELIIIIKVSNHRTSGLKHVHRVRCISSPCLAAMDVNRASPGGAKLVGMVTQCHHPRPSWLQLMSPASSVTDSPAGVWIKFIQNKTNSEVKVYKITTALQYLKKSLRLPKTGLAWPSHGVYARIVLTGGGEIQFSRFLKYVQLLWTWRCQSSHSIIVECIHK